MMTLTVKCLQISKVAFPELRFHSLQEPTTAACIYTLTMCNHLHPSINIITSNHTTHIIFKTTKTNLIRPRTYAGSRSFKPISEIFQRLLRRSVTKCSFGVARLRFHVEYVYMYSSIHNMPDHIRAYAWRQ